MKHFFPSSVMLTPFLVRRIDRDGDQDEAQGSDIESLCDVDPTIDSDEQDCASTNNKTD